MDALPSTLNSGFVSHFERVRNQLHALVAPLSSQQIWRRPRPYGNSIGNLLLHLCGNLNYYIGAQIAGTGYIRQRDREFSDSGKEKRILLKDFDSAIEMVTSTLKAQSLEDWSRAYSAQGTEATDRFQIILSCAAHASHHLGQIIYLQKELTLPAAQVAS